MLARRRCGRLRTGVVPLLDEVQAVVDVVPDALIRAANIGDFLDPAPDRLGSRLLGLRRM